MNLFSKQKYFDIPFLFESFLDDWKRFIFKFYENLKIKRTKSSTLLDPKWSNHDESPSSFFFAIQSLAKGMKSKTFVAKRTNREP